MLVKYQIIKTFKKNDIVSNLIEPYLAHAQNFDKDNFRRELFENLYADKEKHKFLMTCFYDLESLMANYKHNQAHIRVFMIDYLIYIANNYHEYEEIENSIMAIQQEVTLKGDVKARSKDIEDLIYGIIKVKADDGHDKERELETLIKRMKPLKEHYQSYFKAVTNLFPEKLTDRDFTNKLIKMLHS